MIQSTSEFRRLQPNSLPNRTGNFSNGTGKFWKDTSQKSLAGWCREAPLYLSYLAFETSPAQAITNCGKPTLERALLFRITLGCKHLLAESTEIDAHKSHVRSRITCEYVAFPGGKHDNHTDARVGVPI